MIIFRFHFVFLLYFNQIGKIFPLNIKHIHKVIFIFANLRSKMIPQIKHALLFSLEKTNKLRSFKPLQKKKSYNCLLTC